MLGFIKMAARNVFRNTRRSFLTTLVIALGLMFVFVIRGFLNGLQGEAVNGIIDGDIGHIQITRIGYQEALPTKSLDYLFVYSDEVKKILGGVPEIIAVSERISFGGLINHQKSQTTTPFVGVAMDPDVDVKVCPRFPDNVKNGMGSFLKSGLDHAAVIDKKAQQDIEDADVGASTKIDFSKPVKTTEAKNLPTKEGEYFQVAVGKFMVEGFSRMENGQKVKAAIDDDMILIGSDIHGSQKSLAATLVGILDIANPGAGKSIAVLTLNAARNLLSAEGKSTQVVVKLKDRKYCASVQKRLNESLKPFGLHAVRWDELAPFSRIIELQNMIFGVVMFFIVLLVVISITITSLMTVMERTREIGALMAIGYNRRHILSLFLLEGSTIGLMGGLIGVFLGVVIISVLHQVGIPFVIPFTDSAIVIRPFFTVPFVFAVWLVGVLAAVLASLYPAFSASRLSPLEALSHN
jgi:putative ABC transport system permease protein